MALHLVVGVSTIVNEIEIVIGTENMIMAVMLMIVMKGDAGEVGHGREAEAVRGRQRKFLTRISFRCEW